jgi:recombination protein RecR
MNYSSDALEQLVEEFAQFPGIGRKSAHRLAMHVLRQSKEDVHRFAETLRNVKDRITFCSQCSNFTEQDPCRICSNPKRERGIICVVEEPGDVIALEKTHEFKGLYHVLGGALSPLDGIGPEDLKVKELVVRVENSVEEVILALNPDIEGEATTIYLTRLLRPLGVRITRLARGIPIGGNLEFADEATLTKALEGRVAV